MYTPIQGSQKIAFATRIIVALVFIAFAHAGTSPASAQSCSEVTRCVVSGFASKIPGLSACDGKNICQQIKNADSSVLKNWLTSSGSCGSGVTLADGAMRDAALMAFGCALSGIPTSAASDFFNTVCNLQSDAVSLIQDASAFFQCKVVGGVVNQLAGSKPLHNSLNLYILYQPLTGNRLIQSCSSVDGAQVNWKEKADLCGTLKEPYRGNIRNDALDTITQKYTCVWDVREIKFGDHDTFTPEGSCSKYVDTSKGKLLNHYKFIVSSEDPSTNPDLKKHVNDGVTDVKKSAMGLEQQVRGLLNHSLASQVIFYADYVVTTKTAKGAFDNTNSNVKIRIKGSEGNTGWILLDNSNINDFEPGNRDKFSFNAKSVGKITGIDLKLDELIADSWFPCYVQVFRKKEQDATVRDPRTNLTMTIMGSGIHNQIFEVNHLIDDNKEHAYTPLSNQFLVPSCPNR